MEQMHHPSKLLRLPQVLEIVPVSRATIWSWVKDGKFPAPFKLGTRTSVWRSDEIEAYIDRVTAEGRE